jgi:hypothetical protein
MHLFSLLAAKAGAATAATKIGVAVTLSLASLGTAGATGLLPVTDLLQSSDTAVVTPADSGPAPTAVDETVNVISDVQNANVDDGDVQDANGDDGDVQDANGDDGDVQNANGDDGENG